MKDLKDIIFALIDFWKFLWNNRPPARPYIQVGFFLILSALPTGYFAEFLVSKGPVVGALRLSDGESWPNIIKYSLLILGLFVIFYGLFWILPKHRKKLEEEAIRKRVVVIEHRGLTVPVNASVNDAVPSEWMGRRERIKIDQTAFVDGNNRVVDPERSLLEILPVRNYIDNRLKEVDKDDVTAVYGGIASVPYTFLTGYLIDDDNKFNIMDWDRIAGQWRLIEPKETPKEAQITGLEEGSSAEEVVVALSISYPVDTPAIAQCFSGLPVVHMDTEDHQPNNHWNGKQQEKWVEQFIAITRSLCNVKKIHLIVAAQNSVVFQLGRSYDRRNCPDLLVYQYERDDDHPYPWAVEVPRQGNDAQIVKRV